MVETETAALRSSTTARDLVALQRLAGNRAITSLLAKIRAAPPPLTVQRCGRNGCHEKCICASKEQVDQPDEAVLQRRAVESLVVQRVPPEFQVRGKWARAASEPRSIFFDFNSHAIDAAEEAKIAALAGTSASTIRLKGLASEEGGAGANVPLVDARMNEVKSRLRTVSPGTGDPVLVRDLTSAKGNIDYRSVRKVEILVAGALSTTPDCSRGAQIDCGPVPNPFTRGHAQALTLLTNALTALANPTAEPAKKALQLFGGAAAAPAVITGLTQIKNHMPNMLPAIPIRNETMGGHRCINSCEGDVFAYNQRQGTRARMTLGPRYLNSTDVVEQGLTLIHEGSHGTAGLATTDHAYRWQRLLTLLSPAEALENADSYTHLVALIHNPAAAGRTAPADAFDATLTGPQREAATRSIAWLEQYLVQGRLEVRSLFSAAHRAREAGRWKHNDLWYRDNTMADAAPLFGLTNPPAVPSAESKWRLAGIFDRLFQLRSAITGGGFTFSPGATTAWDPGPGSGVVLAPSFFAAAPRLQVYILLEKLIAAAAFIDNSVKPQYVALAKKMADREGGP